MRSLTPLQLFKALSDETRLGIVLLLREAGELCVCDITAAIDELQPKTSRHLAMLRESGLLLDRREGKWIHYRLSPHIPAWAANIVQQAADGQPERQTRVTSRLRQVKEVCP